MAYDQHSTYEPPRRPYAIQQPEPANPGYNDYADYARGPYDHHDQSYSQDFGHPGNYDYGYGQGVNGEQEQDQAAYGQGSGGGGYGGQQYQGQDQGRNYDPRYQSRSQRGPPPQQQQGRPQPRPSTRGQPAPGRPPFRGDPQNQPRQNGYPPGPSGRPRGPSEQSDGYPQQPPRQQNLYANGQSSSAPPATDARPPPPNGQAPRHAAKTSMEEWKAQEKAKFNKQALSPEQLSLDTAFPAFGKRPNERPSTRNGEGRRRSSEQSGRPSTSHSSRPSRSREDSHQSDRSMQPPRRPDISSNVSTPVRDDYPEQWPMVARQTPPKNPIAQRPTPSQTNGNDPRYAANSMGVQSRKDSTSQDSRAGAQRLPGQRDPPPIQPINTNQKQQQLMRPAYMDHQPLSPANLPQRPSTSHSSRRPLNQQFQSPPSQYPQSAVPRESFTTMPNEPPHRPWTDDQGFRHASLSDIYDQYHHSHSTPPRASNQSSASRAEEIEAEMPDFDSAAPGQTSSLHSRTKTADKDLVEDSNQALPPIPRTQTAPPMGLQQSQSAHDMAYSSAKYRPGPGLGQRGPPSRSATDDYAGTSLSASAREGQYALPYRNSPSQNLGYDQGSLPTPQAPYANEPPLRRSMDDGRQMTQRKGPPPPQRMYPNQPPQNGVYPPQQRPEFDQNGTGWSDPAQERVGSAPPPQGGLGGPPGLETGAPLSQQRSAPDHQSRESNPDALPYHPTPVRAGHLQSQSQSSKPLPIRNYNGSMSSQSGPPQPQQQMPVDQSAQPVTHIEIDRLRGAVENGSVGPKQHLVLVKKLVEASTVLINTTESGGRTDPKTAAKNRERYTNEAYKRLKKLVAGGYPDSQFYLADCYGQGTLGVEVDTKEAFKLYHAAAKAGHAQSAYRTAVCCEMGPEEGGGTSKDYPKAVQWYRRAATLGDNAAMYKLGVILLKGLLGQQKNVGEAVTWLKRGAERADLDNPHALHELASLYDSSNTSVEVRNKVIADDAQSRELYMQAAKLGYKFSQFKLGQAHEYGSLGFPISNRDSIAWYTKAAAQGEHQAELALSGWYLTGAEGILEHSDTEAYLWARKAASSPQGGPQVGKAMFAMGYFTENGIGCPASMEEGRKWYGRAAAYKFPKALERLEELRKNGGKSTKPAPVNGKLMRKDQKKDEENCVVM